MKCVGIAARFFFFISPYIVFHALLRSFGRRGGGLMPILAITRPWFFRFEVSFFEVSLGSVVACFFFTPCFRHCPHGPPRRPPTAVAQHRSDSLLCSLTGCCGHTPLWSSMCDKESTTQGDNCVQFFLHKKMHLFPILWRRFPPVYFINQIKSKIAPLPNLLRRYFPAAYFYVKIKSKAVTKFLNNCPPKANE